MFRNKQLDRIKTLERDVNVLYDTVSRMNEDLEMVLQKVYAPVSPAKAPKKRGRKSKTELEKKAKKAAYNKAYYQKRKVTTKKK